MDKITTEQRIENAIKITQELYLSDDLPWVVGYSGGKDSTAVLQLVWKALRCLPKEKLHKTVHVISTDTLVENPVVAIWVENSLEAIRKAADEQDLPIVPHRLTPALKDRFWVNLIGKGYPAPRPLFRWCTSRLKINASTRFINEMADLSGEAIVVLGTRKAESVSRERTLNKYQNSSRELLSRNSDASMDRVWIYAPIADWTSDDVWEYLIESENPWCYDNLELFHMYKGASPDAECPLVVDKSTPSCGDSRFGCFVCTMVTEDKSMQAMIQNDEEKKWMSPLLDFRNKYLITIGDRPFREFTRMDGRLTLQEIDAASNTSPPVPHRQVIRTVEKGGFREQKLKNIFLVHGPYTQQRREELLYELLKAQEAVRSQAPSNVKNFTLISIEEIEEIRRIWVYEKHEFEDVVPGIYERATGMKYPIEELDEATPFRPDDIQLLRELCETSATNEIGDNTQRNYIEFRALRELLDIQHGYRSALRRVGLVEKLDKALESKSFVNEEEALEFALHGIELVDMQEISLDAAELAGPAEELDQMYNENIEP